MYEDYKQQLLYSDEEIFSDNVQHQYDWSDEYQGCPDYMEYVQTWN